MKTQGLNAIWRALLRCANAVERELKLIAAFAPTPSAMQTDIDLEAWPSSRTGDAPRQATPSGRQKNA